MAWQDQLRPGPVSPPLSMSPHVRLTMIDRCTNQWCPNRGDEGRMALVAVNASAAGAKRDLALILCAPCAEYLARMIR